MRLTFNDVHIEKAAVVISSSFNIIGPVDLPMTKRQSRVIVGFDGEHL